MVSNISRTIFIVLLSTLMSCSTQEKKEEPVEEVKTEAPAEKVDDSSGKILFFGNSLTAGYGLDISEAFPALIQERINEKGYDFKVINAGISGETTATGNSRVDWILEQDIDIFVLELGGNDGLRGIPLTTTKANLESIIEKVWAKDEDIDIILAGMEIPPNMGPEYTSEFRKIYKDLAAEYEISFVPFLLKGVGGIPELNLPDGIHPTPEGHAIIVDNVWPVLEPLLQN